MVNVRIKAMSSVRLIAILGTLIVILPALVLLWLVVRKRGMGLLVAGVLRILW